MMDNFLETWLYHMDCKTFPHAQTIEAPSYSQNNIGLPEILRHESL